MKRPAAGMAIAGLVCASLTACGGGSIGNAAIDAATCHKVTLQYAAYGGIKGPPEQIMANWYATELAKRTNGCVTMKGTWSGGLLGADTMLQGVGNREVDMGEVNPIYYPSQLPLSQVVGLPFTNDGNPAAVAESFEKLYEGDNDYRAEWENNNVVVLAFKQVGPNVMGTKKPIASPADMKGLKVRTAGSMTDVYNAIEADPIGIPAQDLYESIQRGTIDAYAAQSLEFLPQQSLAEVAPYTYETGTGVFAIDTTVINKSIYDSLGKDVQKVLIDLRQEYNAKLTQVETAMGAAACDALRKQGATVGVFSKEFVDQWKADVGDSVYSSWADTIGDKDKAKAFFDRYTQQVRTAQKNYPGYESPAQACTKR
jgi:TRAP-type C4-dicarboxylate transport system substrate-binding protein